jgi:peptidoglycan/LPS O-acetylase OafA/YrhL
MPAYWLYVGCITVAVIALPGRLGEQSGWTPGWLLASLWGYFANYAPREGIWEHQALTGHLWSLAVEEQFYFLWPFCCLALLWTGRPLVWITALGAAALGYWWFALGADAGLLYTRGAALLVGCGGAFALHRDAEGQLARLLCRSNFRAATAALTGLLLLLAGISWPILHPGEETYLLAAAFYLPFVVLVMMLWQRQDDWLGKTLAWRPLVFLGGISYGMYLYHLAAHAVVWRLGLLEQNVWVK